MHSCISAINMIGARDAWNETIAHAGYFEIDQDLT